MKKIFKTTLFFIIIFQGVLKAQYSNDDYDLVKTTFTRKFDKSIIQKYLDSGTTTEINAALLSIAQSKDTSFIPQITKLDFQQNAEYICFALGQLGRSKISSSYLFSRFDDKYTTEEESSYILKAIGKTGQLPDLQKLTKDYLLGKWKNFNGISIAFYDFFSRKIYEPESEEMVLRNEIMEKSFNLKRKSEALFAIYRMDLSNNFKKSILKLLEDAIENGKINNNEVVYLQYILSNLRKAKYFPSNEKLFNKLLNLKPALLRVEISKLLICHPFKKENEIIKYLKLLRDDNPNVSRQAAISLKEISIPNSLTGILKDKIFKLITDLSLPINTRGELILSYQKIFNIGFDRFIKRFGGIISKNFIYNAISNYTNNKKAFNFLASHFDKETLVNKIGILSDLSGFNSFFDEDSYKSVIFSSLSNASPALISIAADEVDSSFIANNEGGLKYIIVERIKELKDNQGNIESIQSLVNLSGKISKEFSKKILKKIKDSDIYSIKTISKDQIEIKYSDNTSSDKLFDEIWQYSFEYTSASIRTTRGIFTFKFTPEYAPVSVGNFCKLAEKEYFDNIIFHRVVPGFVIQTGDTTKTGWGGPGYEIVSEFSPLHYSIGAVGMASAGKDTEGSQWFVTTGDFPHLDYRYTIFGFISDGMNVVNSIDQNDKIISVTLNH